MRVHLVYIIHTAQGDKRQLFGIYSSYEQAVEECERLAKSNGKHWYDVVVVSHMVIDP